MTTVEAPAAGSAVPAPPPAGPGATAPPAPPRPWRQPVSPGQLAARTLGTSFLILAVTALGFVAWVGLFSTLHYDKAQLNAYDTLRVELAMGTAPNGPTAPTNPAQPPAPGA